MKQSHDIIQRNPLLSDRKSRLLQGRARQQKLTRGVIEAIDPEEDSQGIATRTPSSQKTASFKRPALPPTVKLQQEIERLSDQLDKQQSKLEEQNKEIIKLLKEQTFGGGQMQMLRIRQQGLL